MGLRHRVLRLLAVAIAGVAAALALTVGATSEAQPPEGGTPAPETYVADQAIVVIDQEATAEARAAAREAVQPQYSDNPEIVSEVVAEVEAFFAAVSLEFLHDQERPEPPPTTTTTSSTTTTSTTSTTLPPEEGDGADTTTTTSSTSTTSTSTTTTSSTTTTTLAVPTIDELQGSVAETYAFVSQATRDTLIEVAYLDLDSVRTSEEPVELLLPELLDAAVQLVGRVYDGAGILPQDLAAVRSQVASVPPVILDRGYPDRDQAQNAVADLVATMLQPNRRFDQARTEEQRDLAASLVPNVTVEYQPEQTIVSEGEVVSPVQAEAVAELLSRSPEGPKLLAASVVVGVTMALLAVYLRRNRPQLWRQPKLVLLFGLIVALAAVVSRLVYSFVGEGSVGLGYVVPAAAFGYLAGVLFDSRAAILLAVPVAVFVGMTSGEIGYTVFAAASVLAPLPFISSASSQRDLRVAILYTALLSAVVAGAVAAFFHEGPVIDDAMLFGFGGGLLGGLVGLGVLPYVDNVFNLTTTLTLLDLTDRNHPALRHLEERAPGTFNHSMLVGTLAGRAARAIGANPLLAEAAAYYHDLGKTENPHLFIENQFGAANPHNWMKPEESAAVIRNHIIEGMRLGREFRIPPEVAIGIRQHHGTSLMRYFYHKALEERPESEVNADDFRHVGQKPQSREMAILMLSDAVEAASRSLAYLDNPTADGLRKVVEQVVDEKMEDGQLDESDLTFGDLTKVKAALTDALTSHYHHRIVYPNFPGGRDET
jgi:putative nucleotidyltransferase with HDIG domain